MATDAAAKLDQFAPRTWQRMLSGRRLKLLDPSPLDIEIEDIALGLARNARWNGQTSGSHAWSVAEHSLLVVNIVQRLQPRAKPSLRLAALLHDGSEYVTHDLITPLKAAVGDVFKEVESRLMKAIHVRVGLPEVLPEEEKRLIKQADKIAAATEAVQLAGFAHSEAFSILKFTDPPLDDITLEPVGAQAAEQQFLDAYATIHAAFELQSR